MRLAKEIFIENLKALRTAKGLSQAKLSELADLSPSIIGDIEVGRRNPTLTTIEKIALALDIPVQQLFYDSEADYPLSAIESREELRSSERLFTECSRAAATIPLHSRTTSSAANRAERPILHERPAGELPPA